MAAQTYPSAYPSIPQRRATPRSSVRLFYLVDAIGRLHEPAQTQLDALESSYRSTGEFLAACPEFTGLLQEIHAHGSRQLGTLIRPRDESREGFDIDLIARLHRLSMTKYGGATGPALLLDDLFAALERYAKAHNLRIQRWERCVTLEYAGGMCADIAPVIDDPTLLGLHGDTLGRIPDRRLHTYGPTNPRGYAKVFDKAASISPNFVSTMQFAEALDSVNRAEVAPLPAAPEVFDRLLSRLVQLLKLHRNVSFGVSDGGADLSPSSIFITTLAIAAYTVKAPQPHDSPLELLLDIVESLPDHFQRSSLPDGSELWLMPNPSAPGENLAGGMNTPERQTAFDWWHRRLQGHLTELADVIEGNAGMDALLAALERAFGKRAARAIRDDEAQRRQGSRQVGRVALISSAAVAPVVATARPHTFFGN